MAITAYSVVTQRFLRAAGRPASWVFALSLGIIIGLAWLATRAPAIDRTTWVRDAAIVLIASSFPLAGAAAGLALTARESRSHPVQLVAALALGTVASLAAPAVALMLGCLVTGRCL